VVCGAAGGLLLTAAPGASGADAGRVPVGVAAPAGGSGPAAADARSSNTPALPGPPGPVHSPARPPGC
jgi:hypothetical protein